MLSRGVILLLQLSCINSQSVLEMSIGSQNLYWNVRTRSDENPHTIQKVPLHSEKVGVWCAISPLQIIGPLFFHEIGNSDCYFNDTRNPFFNQLTVEEWKYGYFQQDSAIAPTANTVMVAIWEVCVKTE
jgi:hypothetical protein